MIEIRVEDIRPARVMEIAHDLRQRGCLQGQDFDFAYHPADTLHGPYCQWAFYNSKWATFFNLKYL